MSLKHEKWVITSYFNQVLLFSVAFSEVMHIFVALTASSTEPLSETEVQMDQTTFILFMVAAEFILFISFIADSWEAQEQLSHHYAVVVTYGISTVVFYFYFISVSTVEIWEKACGRSRLCVQEVSAPPPFGSSHIHIFLCARLLIGKHNWPFGFCGRHAGCVLSVSAVIGLQFKSKRDQFSENRLRRTENTKRGWKGFLDSC